MSKRINYIFNFEQKYVQMSNRPQAIISIINDIATDQRVMRIASTLHKAGYDVLVVGRRLQTSPKIDNYPYQTKRFKLWVNKGPLFYLLFNIRLLLFLLGKKSHLLWSCDLDTLSANYIASKVRKSKLVYDSHELFTEVPELVDRPRVQKIWLSIEKYFLPKVKYTCTVSDGVANEYRERYGIEMIVIRNLPFFKSVRKDNNNEGLSDKAVVIYQGAVNIGRGIEKVVRAFKYIDNAEFWIVGTGDIDLEIIQLIESENLSGKVKFLGRMLPEDLHKITPQAQLGISLEENTNLNYFYALPNKLFDYIQARVPVLVSDFPDMAAIVNNYNIGSTTRECDPEKLAAIISDMLNDTELQILWKANLERAAKDLCWENEEKKILKMF